MKNSNGGSWLIYLGLCFTASCGSCLGMGCTDPEAVNVDESEVVERAAAKPALKGDDLHLIPGSTLQ